MKLSELLNKWEISEASYTKGGWGNAMGSHIKYPASYVKRWTKEIPDPKNPGSKIKSFDNISAFNELALNCIVAIRTNPKYRVIREIDKYWTYMPEDLRQAIQASVYQLMNHIILNRDIWQKVNTSSVSLPNWSATVDSTSWIISGNMLSKYVENMLKESEMSKYKLVTTGEYETYKRYANGDTQLIFNVSDIDNVTQQRIEKIALQAGASTQIAHDIAVQIIKEAL